MNNPENDVILEVNDLKTYFHMAAGTSKAVNGISFSLNKGETLGIVGESGSGKSVSAASILKLITKPGKIEGGSIVFDGKDIISLSEKEMNKIRGKDISMIFQDPMTSLDPVFTIGSQMRELIKTHNPKLSKKEIEDIAVDALESVGISEARNRLKMHPHEFSGGMRQRVMIAMSLVCDSKVIIADEPTTALDVTVQLQILDLLKKIQKEKNVGILLITHDLGVVWAMCHKVMTMYAGNTVEYGLSKDVYSKPLHPYTWGLLKSTPKLSSNPSDRLYTMDGSPPDLRTLGDCCGFYNRCPYAKEICTNSRPELIEVEENHYCACHFQTKDSRIERGEED